MTNITDNKEQTLLVVKDNEFSFWMKIMLMFEKKLKYEGLFYHAIYVPYNGKAYVYKYWVNPRIRRANESESDYWTRMESLKV